MNLKVNPSVSPTGQDVTVRELRLGLFLTVPSRAELTSVVIAPEAPSSLNTA